MRVHLGSSQFRGTNGILKIDGEEQIRLEIGDEDGALLVSMDLYDNTGKRIAKLQRNVWVFHDGNVFEAKSGVDGAAKTFGIQERVSGTIVLTGAAFSESDLVTIRQARFWTKKGRLVEIDPSGDISLAGVTIRASRVIGGPTAIVWDDSGISMG